MARLRWDIVAEVAIFGLCLLFIIGSRKYSSESLEFDLPILAASANFPKTCSAPTSNLNLAGTCSYLNNRVGCCANVTLPSLASCSSSCIALYAPYFCSLSCLDLSSYQDVSTKLRLCQTPANSLFSACKGCAFTESSVSAWADSGSYLLTTTNCYDVSSSAVVDSSIPSFINITRSNTSTIVVNNVTTSSIASFFIYVSSTSAIISGKLTAVALLPTSRTAFTSDLTFTLADIVNNIYKASLNLTITNEWASADYRINPLVVVNTQGTLTVDPATSFVVKANRGGTFSALCPTGVDTTGTDGAFTVGTASICRALTLVGKDPLTITNFALGNTVAFSGMGAKIDCLTNTAASTITLMDGAVLTIGVASDCSTISMPTVVNTDPSTSTSSSVTIAKKVTVTNTLSFSPTVTVVSGGGFAVQSPGMVSFAGGVTYASGSTLDLASGTTMTISGASLQNTITGSGKLNVGGSCTASASAQIFVPVILLSNSKKASKEMILASSQLLTCSGQSASDLEIKSGATVQIATCSNDACKGGCASLSTKCGTQACKVAAAISGNLIVRAGGVLMFTDIGSDYFGIFQVKGTTTFEKSSSLILQLSSLITTSQTTVPFMLTALTPCSSNYMLATPTLITGSSNTRTWEVICSDVTGGSLLSLALGVVQPTSGTQVSSYSYQSSDYQMTLQKDCNTWSVSFWTSTMDTVSVTGVGIPSSGRVLLRSSSCSSVFVVFYCLSATSTADANALCNAVLSDATTSGTGLYNLLRGTQGSAVSSGKGSNTALYGLFALTAIPVLCLLLCFLLYLHRNRMADNQYMQDTATFSNVAASPQPLGQPPYYGPTDLPAYPQPPPYGFKAY